MPRDVLLNSAEHKHLKVRTDFSEKYGDNRWTTPTFPIEFRTIQSEYPIFFQKESKTGQLSPVALLGFEQGENLYLNDGTWEAGYVPLTIKRQPFLIGVQNYSEGGETKQRLVVRIDLDNPRVSESEGQELFTELGSNSPFLDEVAGMLEAIDVGVKETTRFMEALLEFDLLESVTLDVELNNGSRNSLLGLYTIHEDRLNELSESQLYKLHSAGHLQSIYMVMASQSNVRSLLEKKNRRVEKT